MRRSLLHVLLASCVAAPVLWASMDRGPAITLTAASTADLDRIDRLAARFNQRRLATSDSPWIIYHALVGRGRDFELTLVPDGASISALEWILQRASWSPEPYGRALLQRQETGGRGVSFAPSSSALEGRVLDSHFCHALGCLFDAGVSPDEPVRAPPDGAPCRVADLVQAAREECHAHSDLSWALPVFLQSGGPSAWTNRFGEVVTMDGLLDQHLDREAACDACYGSHWRMALARCVTARRFSGGAMRRAEKRLSEVLADAKQSRDERGTLVPPRAFAGADPLSYPGHTLDWICVGLSDREFREQEWVHTAAARLIEELEAAPAPSLDVEAHAVAALRGYKDRCRQLRLARPD